MANNPIYVPDDIKQARGWSVLHPLQNALDIARNRMVVVAAVFAIAFSVIAFRLMDICLLRGGDEGLVANNSLSRSGSRMRADVVDRNGKLLATSLKTSSLYANSKVVIDPAESARKLVTVIPGLDVKDVEAKLSSGKGFVWLSRHLTPTKQAEVIRLGIPGLYFQKDERRVYPHGHLFSHLIGFTDIDNKGIAGIERYFDDKLRTENEPLRVSLDLRVQHILRDELVRGIEKFKAQGAAGIIMDVKTGEVIAMASLPDFDPHRTGAFSQNPEAFFNRTTLGTYEMGSSFKILNTALALDSGTAKIHDEYDVTVPLQIGRFRITDYHASDHWMNVAEIFVKSSNIGSAKLALEAGAEIQQNYFKALGLLDPVSLELPEVGNPLLPKKWSKVTTITASYGYGISVTPLQLVRAVAGIVNKGMMVQPTLLVAEEGAKNIEKVRVVSEETSDKMRKLLHMVVAEGTGRKARVKGYQVGGKTGTANQTSDGKYKKGQNNTSFISAFPMQDPQYVVFIMVDRPQGIKETYGFNAGGWNAAPIAGNIIRKAAPILAVHPVREDKKDGASPMLLNVSIRK